MDVIGNMKVFVNGCFDILHVGHVELFKYARSLGSELTVALDTDERVSKMKGNDRPINKLVDRIKVLESIKYIDNIKFFSSDKELEDLVFNIKPDIMVVGDDYKNKKVIGSQHAKKLIFFEKINGYSTTKTVQNSSIR